MVIPERDRSDSTYIYDNELSVSRKSSRTSQNFSMLEVDERSRTLVLPTNGRAPLAEFDESMLTVFNESTTSGLGVAPKDPSNVPKVLVGGTKRSFKQDKGNRPQSEGFSTDLRFKPKLPPKKKVLLLISNCTGNANATFKKINF